MPILKVDGADLHYQSLGEGPPIVMLHGLLLGNIATWYFGAATTLSKTHQVLLYDLRGHGMSSKAPEGYSLDAMVSDLKALIDAQGHKQVSLVGHSYGALVALHFAIQYPARVSKLVMVEGPLPPARGMQMEEFLELDALAMTASLPENLQAILGRETRQSKKLIQRLQFLATETNLLAQLKAERDVEDEELSSLAIPVQLIYGEASQLVDVGNRLNKHLPQSELHWLPGGHYLPSELPAELSRTIGDFFR